MKRIVTALRARQERAAEVARVEVQVPVPMLGALQEVRERFFSLCLSAGKQVLGAMMEQDRTALCAPKAVVTLSVAMCARPSKARHPPTRRGARQSAMIAFLPPLEPEEHVVPTHQLAMR
jgi:hypothetical protein